MNLRHLATRLLPLLLLLILPSVSPAQAEGLDLSAYRGKVIYLDFWASWCTPCRLSFPWMNDLQQSYANDGLVVIAVNVDHDRALADAFLRSNSPGFKVVYDPDGNIAGKYDFKDMPTSVLIGRDGRVHYTHDGFFPDKEWTYVADVLSLLKQKAP
jgi:cytochrome c biogenesis protein CcmG, thiol:disulfide interchange protein DsbE